MKSFKQVVEENWDSQAAPDFPLPWKELNMYLNGGLRRRHLTLLAGRPGMGKTTLATNVGVHLSSKFKVGLYSMEQPAHEILDMVAAYKSKGIKRPEHMKDELSALSLYVDDNPAVDAHYVARSAVEHQFDFIIIDYLQRMHPLPETKHQNENQQITQTLRALTEMWPSEDESGVNCNIFLLSQLSRGPDDRHKWAMAKGSLEKDALLAARPVSSDLRGSGSIEQDANEIMFIFRADKYRRFPKHDGETEVILAKNRHGKEGTVSLLFSPEEGRFE